MSLPNTCHVHDDCFTCPLKECIHTEGEGHAGRKLKMLERSGEVKKLRRRHVPVTAVAAMLGISRRSVYRLQKV